MMNETLLFHRSHNARFSTMRNVSKYLCAVLFGLRCWSEANAAVTITIYQDATHTVQDLCFARGDTVYMVASGLNVSRSYKIEVKDKNGVQKQITSCLTGSTSFNDSY